LTCALTAVLREYFCFIEARAPWFLSVVRALEVLKKAALPSKNTSGFREI